MGEDANQGFVYTSCGTGESGFESAINSFWADAGSVSPRLLNEKNYMFITWGNWLNMQIPGSGSAPLNQEGWAWGLGIGSLKKL